MGKYKLDNWFMTSIWGKARVCGTVYNNPEFEDGSLIYSSNIRDIEKIDADTFDVHTENSIYTIKAEKHVENDIKVNRIPKEIINKIENGIIINVDKGRDANFVSKHYYKDGKLQKRETNYHIADGMFSTYCNCETHDNGVSYEYSRDSLSFEIITKDKVYVQNVGNIGIRISTLGVTSFNLEPKEIIDMSDEELMNKKSIEQYKNSTLSQEDICKLLSGE